MPPKVFVSSTFVDLKHVREHVSQFIEDFGYNAVLFEKGGIGFDWRQPIDESCYEAVADSEMLVLVVGGRYGSPATDELNKKAKRYNSITRKEYKEARDKNIPVFIFVDAGVLSEYKTHSRNKGNKGINYGSIDNILIFDLIDEIYDQDVNNYIYPFSKLSDITDVLKSQWSEMMRSHIQDKARRIKRNNIKINSFKLFYYRQMRGISPKELGAKVGINEKKIRSLEKLSVYKPAFEDYNTHYFPECEFQLLAKIEDVLNCKGKLIADDKDGFKSHFVKFYAENSPHRKRFYPGIYPFIPVQTKAVVFDFDGTISTHPAGRTTWEMIWESLNYNVNECADLHRQFRNDKISHEEWCKITLEKFKSNRFSKSQLLSLAGNLSLVPGFSSLIDELISKNIKIYIASGSITDVIKQVVGNYYPHFSHVKANEMHFDLTGEIVDIVGTRYDFRGKAAFIRDVVLDLKCSPMDVLFVGNGGNDGWAANAGARTLCVNPTTTDPDDPEKWSANIRSMTNMMEILPFI